MITAKEAKALMGLSEREIAKILAKVEKYVSQSASNGQPSTLIEFCQRGPHDPIPAPDETMKAAISRLGTLGYSVEWAETSAMASRPIFGDPTGNGTDEVQGFGLLIRWAPGV